MSVPPPEAYSAAPVPPAPPVASTSRGSAPARVTFSLNLTAMSTASPTAYVPFCAETSTTYAGDRRISWTPSSKYDDTMAYMSPSISNTSMPEAPSSSPKPFLSSLAHPAAESVPLEPMRSSWTPAPSRAVAIAYMSPSPPSLNVSMSYAPQSSLKPSMPFAAEPMAESVPLEPMRSSWTPWSSREATMAYMSPSISNTSTPEAPSSSSKPSTPSVAEALSESVPLGLISTSQTPSSLRAAAIAYAVPFIWKAAMSQRLPPTLCGSPRAADELPTSVPLERIESSWIPLSLPAMPSTTYVLPPVSIVSMPVVPWSMPKSALPWVAELLGESVPF